MDENVLKERFEETMFNWSNLYYNWAGMIKINVMDDSEITENSTLISDGDWIVNDVRGKSGTYSISHEDYSIEKIKVKNAKKHGINYSQESLKLKVNTVELMKRYQWFTGLFISWTHCQTVQYSENLFKNAEDVSKKYLDEKSTFAKDPHLALYWLLHFGFTLDKRYDEVLGIVNKNNYASSKLIYFELAKAFFNKTNAFYNLEIVKNEEFKDLFLKRRSYLIFWAHSYNNYNINNLDLWWKSISIYPKIDEQLIVKIRWLKNNLKKCNAWNPFENLVKDEIKDTPLLSYIFACNPNTNGKDKTKYSNHLLCELYEHRNHWKSPHKKQFGELLIWDIKNWVSDKSLLEKVSEFYFQGNETCEKYQDIQVILGNNNKNIEEVRKHLKALNTLFEGYDRFDTPTDKKKVYHQKITAYLEKLTPKILKEVMVNVKNHELAKRCFAYLWLSDIKNKKEVLIRLFIYVEFSDYDINKELFGENFPQLIKDEKDSNLTIAKEFLFIPEADFRNDYMWEKSKEAAVMFFLKITHLPSVFEYLIKTIKQAPTKKNKKILCAIYNGLFSKEYTTKINPVLQFSKEQIEQMLDTICQWFLNYGFLAEACRSISHCVNPLAEDWIKEKLDNESWLKQFSHILIDNYTSLDKELKDTFETVLIHIEDHKHEFYLERKDEKSHDFWSIDYYDGTYTILQGKVGTEGKTLMKTFNSKEDSYIEGDILVMEKLKEGYKKINKL